HQGIGVVPSRRPPPGRFGTGYVSRARSAPTEDEVGARSSAPKVRDRRGLRGCFAAEAFRVRVGRTVSHSPEPRGGRRGLGPLGSVTGQERQPQSPGWLSGNPTPRGVPRVKTGPSGNPAVGKARTRGVRRDPT